MKTSTTSEICYKMAREGVGATVEADLLLSHEQRARKAIAQETSRTSKAKVCSVLVTISVLLVLLFAMSAGDWQAFSSEVKAEGEVVHLDAMVETEVARDRPVNAEAAFVQFEEEQEQEQKEVEDPPTTAPALSEAKVTEDEEKEPEKKKKKRKEPRRYASWAGFNETAAEKKIRLRDEAVLEKKIEAKRKEYEANLAYAPKDKRQKELQRIELGKLEATLRKSRGFRSKLDKSVEAKRKDKYDAIQKHYVESIKPREIDLDPEIQKIVDDFGGSLKPPRYCYLSTKGEKVTPQEPSGGTKLVRGRAAKSPSHRGRALLRSHRRRKRRKPPEGKNDAEEEDVISLTLKETKEVLQVAAAKYPCLIMHRDCFNGSFMDEAKTLKLKKWYEANFFKTSKLDWEHRKNMLEDFESLRLGSCAIVGNGDSVLEGRFGRVIDQHDFVIRYNVITKPYKYAVGAKTDGLFDKLNYIGTEYAPDVTPSRFNIFPKYIPFELDPEKLPAKRKALIYGHPVLSTWRKDSTRMLHLYQTAKHRKKSMEAYGLTKIQHASGGFSRVRAIIELLRTGVCDRLDLYGFSSGGGKYFQQSKIVSKAHPIAGENYVYRLWMATGVHGKFCMY